MKLQNIAKKLPNSPGVYRFLDKNNNILYIGRATSLKKRTAQYFRKNTDPRIAEMVGKATDIKYDKTDTVLDSIVLEANEIKKHWPPYNVKDKDGRSFVYIVIGKGEWPYPILVRGRELKKFPKGKNKIFGPYQSAYLANNVLKIIRRIFPYRSHRCSPGSGKACFDYQIGLCPGTCVGEINQVDYKSNIRNIILLLSGEKKRLMKKLKKENPDLSDALKHIQEVSLLTRDDLNISQQLNRIEGYDISHLNGKESYGSMVVFSSGLPDKDEYRLFKIKEKNAGDDLRSLAEVIERRFKHSEWSMPDLIMIDGGRPQIDYIVKVMADKNITIPLVGISKYGQDKLVFAKGAGAGVKQLAKSIKGILLKVREEAHRFAISAGRRRRSKFVK